MVTMRRCTEAAAALRQMHRSSSCLRPPPPPPIFLPKMPWLRALATSAAEPRSSAANTKKPPLPKRATPKDGEDQPHEDRRFANLVDACLNAPPLVRVLKEKDRLREMEREKLGIVSREREKEIEQEKEREKAAKKKSKGKKAGPEGATEGKGVGMAELSVEEGKRLAKESSRVLMREERERQAGESTRLKLKLAAIAALPEHLRVKAMEPDLSPFPSSRIPASLTPPLEGYIKEMAKIAEKVTTTKKMR